MAVSTIGLIAGAASRNASAAAGVTPRRISEPAIGTEPHSQPGSTTPAQLATGTASAGCRGSALAKNDRGTNTAMTADSATPNTRNGIACTITETKTVVQVCRRGLEMAPEIGSRKTTSRTRRTARTSTEPTRPPRTRRRGRRGGSGRPGCAGMVQSISSPGRARCAVLRSAVTALTLTRARWRAPHRDTPRGARFVGQLHIRQGSAQR